jgi:hypothetical protein
LDACLKADPFSKVACETATKDNMVMVFGEITTAGKIDYEAIVREQVREIGFDSFVDDLGSVVSKGLNCDDCEVLVRINKQSPDIAGGVHVGRMVLCGGCVLMERRKSLLNTLNTLTDLSLLSRFTLLSSLLSMLNLSRPSVPRNKPDVITVVLTLERNKLPLPWQK